ncbi:hypothetical protein LCGC14_0867630 [marine sediment metagenome]|uniref:Uncharacterized protein n=1 Tax=marine sediment metagenome TaxID=412755 RepID=A0A0F9P5J9_9ZZZZ|nr:hypothetical protein [Desulfobacterales bacterium]
MEGIIRVVDKETGDDVLNLNVWVIFMMLSFRGHIDLDIKKFKLFIDLEEIPCPEILDDES